MKTQLWLWLLLALLFSPERATAQAPRRVSPSVPPPSKPSHRSLPGELDLANVQEMMTDRLQQLRELHELQDRVHDLLKDQEFLSRFQKLSDEDLKRLRNNLLQGKGLAQDRNWTQLLQKAQERGKLTAEQIKTLSLWANRHERKLPSREPESMLPDNGAEVPPAPPPPPVPGSFTPSPPSTMTEPSPSLFDRLQEETTKWLIENFDHVSGDVLQTLTEMGTKEGDSALAELARSVSQSDFSGLNISEHPLVPALRTGTFSRYLSDAGNFFHRHSGVWDKVGSLFHKAPLPSLPNARGPSVSMHTPAAPEGSGWLPAFLCLLLLGLIVLILFKKGFGPKGQTDSGADDQWRLGSWPVPPGAVSSRQDLVRAFEYLALLCFGPAAAACHHRQLAQRLAERDSENPARRQAADMLAWLYEQARYAPAEQTLSQEQLSDARHALCSLAGVTAA